MKQTNGREILGAFRTPRAPQDLRRRVLDAGGEAIDRPPETTIWDALWESRVARAAWVVATLALIAAHIGISFPEDSRVAATRAPTRNQMDDLRGELDLPSFEISRTAEARVMGVSPSRESESRNDPDDPEDNEVQG